MGFGFKNIVDSARRLLTPLLLDHHHGHHNIHNMVCIHHTGSHRPHPRLSTFRPGCDFPNLIRTVEEQDLAEAPCAWIDGKIPPSRLQNMNRFFRRIERRIGGKFPHPIFVHWRQNNVVILIQLLRIFIICKPRLVEVGSARSRISI